MQRQAAERRTRRREACLATSSWPGAAANPPAHLVLGVGDEAQTDEQRKWESIKKEVVDHNQFFEDSEDEETGGFDCIAR